MMHRSVLGLLILVGVFAAAQAQICIPELVSPHREDVTLPVLPPGTRTSCDPLVDLGCSCVQGLNTPLDYSQPWGACPACPHVPDSCPNLVPPKNKKYICRRTGNTWKLQAVGLPANLNMDDFLPSFDNCCSCDRDLCLRRQQSIATYESSFGLFANLPQGDLNALNNAYTWFVGNLTTIFTEDANMTTTGIGSFAPRSVLIEYNLIVTPFASTASVTQYTQDYGRQWDGNSLLTSGCSRVRYDLENFAQATFVGYNQQWNYTFVEGSHLIKFINLTPPCAFIQPPSAMSASQIQQTCGILTGICSNIPGYDFPNDFQSCVSYWTSLIPKQNAIAQKDPNTGRSLCDFKWPGTTDSSGCRQIHFLSALVAPEVHCVHTNRVSATCFDKSWDNPGQACADAGFYHPTQ